LPSKLAATESLVHVSNNVLPVPRASTRSPILLACNKCEWKAAFSRHDLIASRGANERVELTDEYVAAFIQRAQ
jgi:hypothetical protein